MTQKISEHKVYQSPYDIPSEFDIREPIYRPGQILKFECPESKNHGKQGFVNNILYAPNIDHYYQRVQVNIGNYNFIESASRFWQPIS